MNNSYLTNIMYNAGIYIRLSQEDKDKKYESDSESVLNQRQILTEYANNQGFNLIDEYIDDGYSGTTFDRPGFEKMINDIVKKKIIDYDTDGVMLWNEVRCESKPCSKSELDELNSLL